MGGVGYNLILKVQKIPMEKIFMRISQKQATIVEIWSLYGGPTFSTAQLGHALLSFFFLEEPNLNTVSNLIPEIESLRHMYFIFYFLIVREIKSARNLYT